MTNKITESNLELVFQKYIESLYNEYPDSLVIVKDGIEITATELCRRLGGTPKGKTNYEFLNAQLEIVNVILSHNSDEDRGYDD